VVNEDGSPQFRPNVMMMMEGKGEGEGEGEEERKKREIEYFQCPGFN